MDDSRFSLEFDNSVDLDKELGNEVPDLHRQLNANDVFEIDVRFEFDAPQYYDFMEELTRDTQMKQVVEDPSQIRWFSEHHVRHESQKTSSESAAPILKRCPVNAVNAQPDESASIEKLLAEHNRKIREENLLKVKSRRGDSEATSRSPLKRTLISNESSKSPQRSRLLRKSVIVSSTLQKSSRPSKLLRKSVIVPPLGPESPGRIKKPAAADLLPSESASGLKHLRKPTGIASSCPTSPQRKRSMRTSVIVPECSSTGLKLRARNPNIDAAVQDNPVDKLPDQNAPIKKRTRVEINVCIPTSKSIVADASKNPAALKKPRFGKENMDDIAEMLANHNQKFKSRPTYVPRQHSTRDVRQWERSTGKLWYELSPDEREIANQEIAEMKNAQKPNIQKPSHEGGLGYLSCPR